MIDKLINFILKYTDYKEDRDKIRSIIEKHLKYDTYDYCLDKQGRIMFLIRWNINGDTANILDLVINPIYRRQLNYRWFIARGVAKFPYVQYLTWVRHKKYPYRQPTKYSVSKLLKFNDVLQEEVV